MRVLVYEPKYVGHFLGFATWTANAFAKLGHEVIFAVPVNAEGTQQAEVKLASIHPDIDLQFAIDVPLLFEEWKNARFESAALLKDLQRLNPDHVVVPSADFLISSLVINGPLRRALGRLGGVDFILHNCPQAYPTLGPRDAFWRMVDRLAVDLARKIRIHTVDPYATQSESHSMSLFGSGVLPLPHPFESVIPRDKAVVRERLGLPSDARVIGSLGDLGVRKGTDLLLRSFYAIEDTSLMLALFGVLSQEIRDIVNERQDLVDSGRIHVCDEFVSDETFGDALFAVDGLWTGYPRQIGISSLLLFAAETQQPVLSSSFGCVGWMTREYGMGRTFEPKVDAAAEAMRWFAEDLEFKPDAAGAKRLLDYHTLENFEEHITAGIRARA